MPATKLYNILTEHPEGINNLAARAAGRKNGAALRGVKPASEPRIPWQLPFLRIAGITDLMMRTGALVLYKNQLCRVASNGDGKITLDTEMRETKKVREKDVVVLHPGPSSGFPVPRDGGDFETAHAMLVADQADSESVRTSWKELADLVFGEFSPDSVAACVLFALRGSLFKVLDGEPYALSMAEVVRIRGKNERKLQEGLLRQTFIDAFKKAIKAKDGSFPFPKQESSRFLSELESFALGASEHCPIAAEAGLAETREAVHQALLDAGIWSESVDPWPGRAGCNLTPPKAGFPDKEIPELSIPRLDLTGLEAYAIDNAWSKDPDDAISFDGNIVWVHIADPAAFLAPGSAIDAEALDRGATLYLPEKTVPMLPEEAVSRLGLGLHETSIALSFGIELSADGSIAATKIVPSTLRVSRFSYEEADAMLENGDETLAQLDKIAQLRHSRRLANEAVDIDFPEVSIRADGESVVFRPVPTTRSGAIVREMMLLAGEAAARWARERRIPFVYSSQESPQIPKSALVDTADEHSLSLQFVRRKGMRASIVGTESLAHRGLGLSFYSQVTSPLRRYQDLLAHYQIRAFLASEAFKNENLGNSGNQGKPMAATLLGEDEISRRCILSARAASSTRQAERDARLHWISVFLKRNPGWKGDAVVLDVYDRDVWVFIPEFGIESAVKTRLQLSPDETVVIKNTAVFLTLHDFRFEIA